MADASEAGGTAEAAAVPAAAPAEGEQPAAEAVDAEGGESLGNLNFREHMWDQFDLLWRQRIEPTRKKLEVYIGCLRERAQLERHYAKGLERIFNKIQPESEQGNSASALPVAMEALACNFRARIEQSMQLAEEIDQDVVMTIEAMLKQHGEVSRLMFTDGQRLTRHWQDAQRTHEQLSARYAQVSTEAVDCAKECMAQSSLRPAEWKKYAQRSVALSRHASSIEQDYNKAVQHLNSSMEIHSQHMGGLLSSLQDMEEKRAQCFKDAAMKIAVHEISWVRNVQYDIDSVVQAVEETDSRKEMQEFIQQHRTKAEMPTKVTALTLRDVIERRQQVPAPAGPEVPNAQQLEAVRQAIKPVLANTFDEGQADAKEALEALLLRLRQEGAPAAAAPEGAEGGQAAPVPEPSEGSPASWRRAVCDVLKEELQESTVSLSTAPFEQAVRLFTAALDGCDRAADAWNGRDLMVAARKIQSQPVDGRRIDALLRVYKHPLWSRVTFWEDVLLVGIAEAHCLKILGSSPTAGNEVAMTSFLESYLGFMVTLGIKTEEAQGCVQRTLRKHAQLLGPHVEAYIARVCDVSKLGGTVPGGTATALSSPAPAEGAAPPDAAAQPEAQPDAAAAPDGDSTAAPEAAAEADAAAAASEVQPEAVSAAAEVFS